VAIEGSVVRIANSRAAAEFAMSTATTNYLSKDLTNTSTSADSIVDVFDTLKSSTIASTLDESSLGAPLGPWGTAVRLADGTIDSVIASTIIPAPRASKISNGTVLVARVIGFATSPISESQRATIDPTPLAFPPGIGKTDPVNATNWNASQSNLDSSIFSRIIDNGQSSTPPSASYGSLSIV